MSNWLHYDWYTQSEQARFAVDLALARRAEYPVAVRLLCIAPPAKEKAVLSAREKRHIGRIEGKCLKQNVLLAGRVETPTRMELYYYAPDLEILEAFEAVAEREKLLRVLPDAQEDPDWTFYNDYLYPDAAKYQTVANGDLIAKLCARGEDPAAARRIQLHMFFPSEPLLNMFTQQARQEGFALGPPEYRPDMEQAYGAVIVRVCTLEKRAMDALTTQAIYLAQRYEGILSHWTCPSVPKRSPLR